VKQSAAGQKVVAGQSAAAIVVFVPDEAKEQWERVTFRSHEANTDLIPTGQPNRERRHEAPT